MQAIDDLKESQLPREFHENAKDQITNNKQYPNSKFQCPKGDPLASVHSASSSSDKGLCRVTIQLW
jgi:hypothetical protein